MVDRFVGPGGNDGNSGLTWALRKLTLNGVEDTPVIANDTVYVGAGVYRELLTCDVSGGAGTPITYIGDVTGENTDGVGGIARITGSDNDQTAVRANCITASGKNYRTFRGFMTDLSTVRGINISSGNNWILEDHIFQNDNGIAVRYVGINQSDNIIRRCIFLPHNNVGISFIHGVVISNTNHLVENCIFVGQRADQIRIERIGGGTIRNCSFWSSGDDGIDVQTALAVGQKWDVNNCIFVAVDDNALEATALGEIVEDYNTFFNNSSDRLNVAIGANSVTYPPLLNPPILFDGIKFPWWFGELSEWSQIRAITGTAEATDDFYGMTRPVTSAKKSWGAIQFVDAERETGTVQDGSVGRVLNDAGVRFVRRIATTNVATTVSIFLRRETNYVGGVPRMIIRQPGQADRTTDMAAAVDTWEQLTDSFTPAALPGYVDVLIESRNTALAGAFSVFFDSMDVT